MKYQIKGIMKQTLQKLVGPTLGLVIGVLIGLFGSKFSNGFFQDVIPTQDSMIVSCDTMMNDTILLDSNLFMLNGDTIKVILQDTIK